MPRAIVPVILSGGSGTRLWPLSRELQPKQFLPLVSTRSLFQDALLRTRGLEGPVAEPYVVCNEDHRFVVAEQLREIGASRGAIVLEPQGRNTAPAVAVAALLAERAQNAAEDPLLLVLPADHVILNHEAFAAAVAVAIDAAAAGRLVAFGIVPSRPETGYGYIRRKAGHGSWSILEEFVEKPDLETARCYVESGHYLWNSGMFLFSARDYLRELDRYAPSILRVSRQAVAEATIDSDFTRLGSCFLDCPSDSIDYAVMEKTDKAAVVPLDAGWSDVGSWAALHEVLEKDADGNTLRGDVIADACKNTYITSSSRLVVGVGLEGVIVVETDDAVVVMAHAHSQRIKRVVDALKINKRPEARTPRRPRSDE